ncbi:hypothetical protein CQA53_05935 [Helicobacter didelphidarum]|uniref:Uncharacterized protein n=1 Tax=Helicobacter didelphidarum TaxID=2040648 RepID=A0A3D8IKZ8_9HELI|nr:hypothetical protein [Helicobacter didelphidarum]RDU65700.1 hypothetical protein CQA53_05935 [Helicobacter didelphidarum]
MKIINGYILLLLALFILIGFFFMSFFKIPLYNTEEKLLILSEPKHIVSKDFYILLESLLPKSEENDENISITSKQLPTAAINKKEKDQPQEILTLLAILNQSVLINEKWYNLSDTIYYNNQQFIIKKILKNEIILQNKNNSLYTIVLEIFPQEQDLILEKFN